MFVHYGSLHQCQGTSSPAIQSTPSELRIAAALERIAKALEKLSDPSGDPATPICPPNT